MRWRGSSLAYFPYRSQDGKLSGTCNNLQDIIYDSIDSLESSFIDENEKKWPRKLSKIGEKSNIGPLSAVAEISAQGLDINLAPSMDDMTPAFEEKSSKPL